MKTNKQKPESPTNSPKGSIDFVHIWATIQGEGPYAGLPAVFVRLAGCNLQCPGCDTDYTSDRGLSSPGTIVREIQELMKGCLVVLTGGEPFRQNIQPLVRQLLNSGYEVQIESNGTFPDKLPPIIRERVTIVCSPKTPKLHPDFKPDYYKYVIDAKHVDSSDGLPSSVLGMKFSPARPREGEERIPIYIQPMDHGDPKIDSKNIAAAVSSVLKFNYRLCLQLHKIVGME